MPQVWCEPCEVAIAPGPWSRLQRLISPATRSSASSQEMRTYSDLPRFCGLRLPLGSKSTRFIGCRRRFGRIDDRFRILPMRRQRRLARRRELHAARLDRPRLRIAVVEIDRRHAHDLVVLDGDEDRPAIGHVAIAHRAVGHRRAKAPVRGLHHHEGLREPVGQVLRTVDAEHEILLRIDLIEPIDRRRQQRRAGRGILEEKRDIGLRMQAGARCNLAVADLDPAANALVARLDLRDQIALFQARRKLRIPPGHKLEQQRQREKNEREFRFREHRARPQPGDRWTNDLSRACRSRAGASTVHRRSIGFPAIV